MACVLKEMQVPGGRERKSNELDDLRVYLSRWNVMEAVRFAKVKKSVVGENCRLEIVVGLLYDIVLYGYWSTATIIINIPSSAVAWKVFTI